MARPVPRRPIAEKEILSFREAADYLSVSCETLLEIVRAGKIPAGKLIARWRLKKSDIDVYVRTQKNALQVEEENRQQVEAAKREALNAANLLKPKKPPRTLTTALLLKHTVDTLSATPCYLVGPASQSLLNTHVSDGSAEWDLVAKGSLAEVLSRVAELFFTEGIPSISYQREELALPADINSLESVKEKLATAIALVGFSREDGNRLKLCADELVTNAVRAGGQELRVIIETGTDDLLLTVINQGEVKDLAGRMPGPEAERGRGIALTKNLMHDFLLLSTNDRVIATIRKVRSS